MKKRTVKKAITFVSLCLLVSMIALGCLVVKNWDTLQEEETQIVNEEELFETLDYREFEEVEPVNLTTGFDHSLPNLEDDPDSGDGPDPANNVIEDDRRDEDGNLEEPFDIVYPEAMEDVVYDDKTLLIKIPSHKDAQTVLKNTGIEKTEEMFSISSGTWYEGFVRNGSDIQTVLEKVREIDDVLVVEYNFVWETTDTIIESDNLTEIEGLCNNNYVYDQWYLRSCGIQGAWQYQLMNHLPLAGEGTVIAVIDTGVDYTHADLFASMWINHNEIPDNGIDDDNNGYIDDYYGADIVNGQGSAKDDHGHGTHVAGIIAAANNNVGTVGIAFNAKIMAIKAGNASGYFLQSDIVKAILYAHNNGADVINMSFGGSASTIAVQDALEFAYTDCVLVAAAGNDGVINEYISGYTGPVIPSYPAAFSYVLGVMSVDSNGVESYFTNFDGISASKTEYEVYAPGSNILSTIPNNRYAYWSGTSMATPVISAMAAMIRSNYSDRSIYPTKFIYGQISSTSELNAVCYNPSLHTLYHNKPMIANAYYSLTKTPTPEVYLRDYTLFDTESFSTKNNSDGVVDSGEIIALGFEVWNRWGMAKDTNITISAYSPTGIPNPYVTFATSLNGQYGYSASINYGDVGTYSSQDAGKVYDGDLWVGWDHPFYVKVADNCPNDMLITINVQVTAKNALNEYDHTLYNIYGNNPPTITLAIRNGYILPSVINEDMTWTADNYYILSNSVYIPEGVTVNVEPGTQIQFWANDPEDTYADTAIVFLKVDGTINFNGTQENHIRIFPSELFGKYGVQIFGNANLNYCDVTNPYLRAYTENSFVNTIDNCNFNQNYKDYVYIKEINNGIVRTHINGVYINCNNIITNSSFYKLGSHDAQYCAVLRGYYENCSFIDSCIYFFTDQDDSSYSRCLFYGNNNYLVNDGGGVSKLTTVNNLIIFDNIAIDNIIRNEETGTTYAIAKIGMQLKEGNAFNNLDQLLQSFDAHIVSFESETEYNYVKNNYLRYQNEYLYYRYIFIDKNGKAQDINGNVIELNNDAREIHNKLINEVDLSEGMYITCAIGDCCEYGYYETFYKKEQYLNGNAVNYCSPYNYYDGAQYRSFLIEIPGEIYITEIGLAEDNIDIDVDTLYQIVTNPYPETDQNLIYESKDETVINVDASGLITPRSNGNTEVYVYSSDRGVYSVLNVNVIDTVPLSTISATIERSKLNVGEKLKIHYTLLPENTTKKSIRYVSNNEDVCKIDKNGIITAINPGTAIISVVSNADEEIHGDVEITVTQNITDLYYKDNIYCTNLEKEDGFDFYPTIYPHDYTEGLIWESSNPEIAYVDNNGQLVKLQNGTAKLKVISDYTRLESDVIISISDYQDTAKTIKMESFGENSDYYVYALLNNGELWTGGTSIKSPKKS